MTSHWKVLQGVALIAATLIVLAFVTNWYVVAIGFAYALIVLAFVMAAAWMTERPPQTYDGHSHR